MFKLQELSNLIESQLNSAGENFSPAYSFRIFTEIGKNVGSSYINCVLRQQKPSVSVVPNVINNTYILVLDVVVPANTVNFNLANVQEIFNGVIENVNGKEQEFKDGKGIVTFTLADTGNFKTEYGQGNIVPISYNIFVNYAENVVLDKHYLLNGQEIPFTYDELLIEKDGVTKPIYGENFQKSFATLQRKFFHFRMPKSTIIATNLIADILREEPNKEYTLTYYDGDIFTQQTPFTTKVEIFRTANARSQRPQTTELDITFAEVDDETSLTIYELALIDNQFDADSENTRYFESQEQQQAYFEDYIENYGADWDRIKVPNLNSIDLTNQIYKNTNNYDLFDLVNKNYAIIKVTQNSGLKNEKVNYFYYFVNSAQIGLYNQVSYDLKLDTLQTYYYNENIEFNGTFISKAHLNRWIDNGDGTISFNGKADSDLFEREEIKQVAKRLVAREKLKIDYENVLLSWILKETPTTNINTSYNVEFISNGTLYTKITFNQNSIYYDNTEAYNGTTWTDVIFRYIEFKKAPNGDLLNWLESNSVSTNQKSLIDFINEYILCWMYIFIDGEHNYNYFNSSYTSSTIQIPTMENSKIQEIKYPTSVLCVPVFKEIKSILSPIPRICISNGQELTTGNFITIGMGGFTRFLIENNNYSYIKTIKLSIKPPFYFEKLVDYDIITNSSYKTLKINVPAFNENTIGIYQDATPAELQFVDKLCAIRTTSNSGAISYAGVFVLISEYNKELILSPTNIQLPKLKFTKQELNTNNLQKNKKYNPKINNVDYKEFIVNISGTQQIFDYQKLNNENVKFSYFEALTCDTTKAIIRYISSSDDDIFTMYYSNSLNGLIYSNDLSLPIANDQLSNYLANNKNAYLSFQNQQQYSTNMFLLNSLSNIPNGVKNPNEFALNTLTSAIKQGMQLAYNKTQFDLSIDNMKNAPNSLINANGSVIFSNTVNDYGVYLELYEGLNTELETANDIIHQNGFTYNKVGNVKDFDNIRKYFNYVQAVIGNIGGIAMSNVARNDLRQRFMNGVRFWNTDEVNYNVENIEKSIILVYNVDYNITSDRVYAINPRPNLINYGVFETKVTMDGTYSYDDIQVTISVVKNGVTTPLTGNFMDNEGKITLDMTNSNYNTYFKDNLLLEDGNKIVITIADV